MLHGIRHTPEVPSAQVKSCVLLAGLGAQGTTEVIETAPTRDHTERALETFSIGIDRSGQAIRVRRGPGAVALGQLDVPGDISGAAFWCALAAGTPNGEIHIEQRGAQSNPHCGAGCASTRRRMTSSPNLADDSSAGAARTISSFPRPKRTALRSQPSEVPGLIDEIPALAALAAMMPAGRTLTVRGAGELRVKESDRISALAAGFRAMGAHVEEFDDGFRLESRRLHGAEVDAAGDHRLAMAFADRGDPRDRAGHHPRSVVRGRLVPGFFETLDRLTRMSGRNGAKASGGRQPGCRGPRR